MHCEAYVRPSTDSRSQHIEWEAKHQEILRLSVVCMFIRGTLLILDGREMFPFTCDSQL